MKDFFSRIELDIMVRTLLPCAATTDSDNTLGAAALSALENAWSIIKDPRQVKDLSLLDGYLNDQGVGDADDCVI